MVLERICANTFAKVGPKVASVRPQSPCGQVWGCKMWPNLSKMRAKLMRNAAKEDSQKTQKTHRSNTRKVEKNLPWIKDWKTLGRHFGRPMPPKRGPRGSQNLPKWSPKREKFDVKKQVVFRLDFFIDLINFFMVF